MSRQKFEYRPEALQSGRLATAKPGDVFLIRQQPAEPSADDEAAAAPPAQLGCYLLQAPNELVGVLPSNAKHLVAYGELQASVRSVKRDAQGDVKEVLLRIEITPDGPVTYAASKPSGQEGLATRPEYVLHDDGFQLRRSQLEQLVHSQDLNQQLADERLQQLLTAIDSSANREQALAQALERPEFKDFSEQVLQLLDAGLPVQVPA